MALAEFEIRMTADAFAELVLAAENDLHAEAEQAIDFDEWTPRFMNVNHETHTVRVVFARKPAEIEEEQF